LDSAAVGEGVGKQGEAEDLAAAAGRLCPDSNDARMDAEMLKLGCMSTIS